MGTVDSGFFEALTGPLQASNTIQQSRDAQKVQQLQLQEQEFQLQQKEAERQQSLQTELKQATEEAHQAIFNNSGFKRDKDATDYGNWHQNYSGFADIEQILKQYGSVSNAKMHGNLNEALMVYKQRVQTASSDPTKGNPILLRANNNKLALEQYKKYALNPKYGKLLTSNSHQRFEDWENGLTDNFEYTGVRRDYLDETSVAFDKSQKLDLDSVVTENFSSIAIDMERDLGRPSNTFSFEDMKSWLGKELAYDDSNQRFAGQAIYGEKVIETDYATELLTGIEASGKMGLRTGNDVFDLMSNGKSVTDAFDSMMSINWDRLGGYDKNSQMHSTMGYTSPSKGLQVMGSSRILGNDRNLETALTNSWAGTYDDKKTPRYNSQKRQVYGVAMKDLYDRRGHKITDSDIASMNITGKDLWQESETDDLRLTGYYIALEGKNKDGDTFLLTDVANESDMNKLKEQYGDIQFDYVMVAELMDDDLGPDDAYYKKIDMSQTSMRSSINKNIDPEELNTTLNQMADYDQKVSQAAYATKQKLAREAVLVKQMNLQSSSQLEETISSYDNSLAIGLGTAGVQSRKIQQAIPMLIADLYVASQQQKEFPVTIEKDAQGNATKIANNSYELMSFRAEQLKMGLIKKMPGFEAMLDAIKTGNYDKYRRTTMEGARYAEAKQISKDISQYYNYK